MIRRDQLDSRMERVLDNYSKSNLKKGKDSSRYLNEREMRSSSIPRFKNRIDLDES